MEGLFGLPVCLDEIVKSINLDLICEKSSGSREYQFKNIRHISYGIWKEGYNMPTIRPMSLRCDNSNTI